MHAKSISDADAAKRLDEYADELDNKAILKDAASEASERD